MTVAVLYIHRLCLAAQQPWQRHESGGLGPVQVAVVVVHFKLLLANALATMMLAGALRFVSFMSHGLRNTGQKRCDCPWQGLLRPVVAFHTLS